MFIIPKINSSFSLDEHSASQVAGLFHSFSDTSRVRILSVLTEREENVGSLARLVGISESAIYHHLRSLRQLGSVQTRREGKEIYYRVDDKHLIAIFHEGLKHIQYE